jgi:hypothetical protein
MSLRQYGGKKSFTLPQLEVWLNQREGSCRRKIVDVRTNEVAGETVGEVDLSIPKPQTKIRVQMGHVPPVGSEPIKGRAFIVDQPMDVTVSRV